MKKVILILIIIIIMVIIYSNMNVFEGMGGMYPQDPSMIKNVPFQSETEILDDLNKLYKGVNNHEIKLKVYDSNYKAKNIVIATGSAVVSLPGIEIDEKNILMIGVDEAGRGSWAGPLVSTACWFDFTKYKSLHSEINDSKKLKSSKRKEIILSLDSFVKYFSSIASVEEIDKYGLSYANSIAMKRSIFSLIQELKKTEIANIVCVIPDGGYRYLSGGVWW